MSKTPPLYPNATSPSAPPSYSGTVVVVRPSSPFTPPIQSARIAITVGPIGSKSIHIICPDCNAEIETTTVTEPGVLAYITGGILALCGCVLGCCLIPCCIDECRNTDHYCPNCNSYLGRYTPIFS